MTDKKASSSRKRTRKPEDPENAPVAPVETKSPAPAPSPVSDSKVSKNARPVIPTKPRGNPGSGSRFIPGGNFQGGPNGHRKASWNPNLAVSRGYPNGAARTSR